MPKRSRRKPAADPVKAAFDAVEKLTGSKPNESKKNPAAVALGRLGGLKGGHARAKGMTQKERSESARKAAEARWSNKPK